MPWYVYILECADSSFYVGIAGDPKARLAMHNAGVAAAWTKARRPVRLVFTKRCPDKSAARRRELEIKGWRREKKVNLMRSDRNMLTR